jgi:RNA polymerase sigma-70 factor (ECF subfamily)
VIGTTKTLNGLMLDEALIAKCIEGNRAAQEQLYKFYARRMRGVCVRYAKSDFEAEDIFQEAFIKVFRSLKNFKMEGSFDGWVRRIVVNTAIDHYKENLVTNNQIHLDLLEDYQGISVEMPADLEVEDMMRILERLPDGYKMVFNLYAIEGYSHKEIADMMNISEGTSKSQLSKARRYIQVLFQQNSIEENDTRTN